ncbi:uncharacterized protein B0I36DRAFT_436004 [Microdochium trichocladiopsis]|uniref:Uncharacterized protein n=1 Tax=Microdochium trichocladiopsis TaxID=1682393 RepID=A0A9P9BIZ4_9PEZI|nr:uncharacterized protein B0I36DRAFT_436004 [Microdochium trichocladiopsis]KAH7016241.1 hypothetical protein B0I36DRAFT_436004 [Microdochium trichocladiopsis]
MDPNPLKRTLPGDVEDEAHARLGTVAAGASAVMGEAGELLHLQQQQQAPPAPRTPSPPPQVDGPSSPSASTKSHQNCKARGRHRYGAGLAWHRFGVDKVEMPNVHNCAASTESRSRTRQSSHVRVHSQPGGAPPVGHPQDGALESAVEEPSLCERGLGDRGVLGVVMPNGERRCESLWARGLSSNSWKWRRWLGEAGSGVAGAGPRRAFPGSSEGMEAMTALPRHRSPQRIDADCSRWYQAPWYRFAPQCASDTLSHGATP